MFYSSLCIYLILIACHVSWVSSGVPGLNKFVRARSFSSAWTTVKKIGPSTFPVDHVCIDINNLLHQSLRDEEASLGKSFAKLRGKLDQILKKLQPRQSVVFAIDGTAPYAKLITQRLRRRTDPSACRLTPGTSFMEICELNLLSYITNRLEKHDGVSFFLSNSNSPTEGEVKIVEWIRNIMPLSSTASVKAMQNIAIVGSDTDLVLQALCISQDLPTIPKVYVVDDSVSFQSLNIFDAGKALNLFQSTLLPTSPFIDNPSLASLDPVILFLMIGNDYLPRFRLRTVESMFYNAYPDFVASLRRENAANNKQVKAADWFEPLYDNASNTFNWKSLYLFMLHALDHADNDVTVASTISVSGEVAWINDYRHRKESKVDVFEWEELDIDENRFSAQLTINDQVFKPEGEFSSRKDAKRAAATLALRHLIPERYEELLVGQQLMTQQIVEIDRLIAKDKLEAVIEYLFPTEETGDDGEVINASVQCDEAIPDDIRASIELLTGIPLYILRKVRDTDVETYLYGLLWNMDMYKRGECSDFGYCYNQRPTLGPKEMMGYIQKKVEEFLERPIADTDELLQELKRESVASHLNAAVMKVGRRKYTSSLKSEISILCLTPPAVANSIVPRVMKSLWRKIQEEAFSGQSKKEKLPGYSELVDFIGTEIVKVKVPPPPAASSGKFSHKRHKQLKQWKQKKPVVQVAAGAQQSSTTPQKFDSVDDFINDSIRASVASSTVRISQSSSLPSSTALHALSYSSSSIAASSTNPTSDDILSRILSRTVADWTVVAREPTLADYRGNFTPKRITWTLAIPSTIPSVLHKGYSCFSTRRSLDD